MLPAYATAFIETPTPLNPLGAKGVGESGCIAAPAAIVNAVLDALAPLGITSIDMPLSPEKVWSLVRAALRGTIEEPPYTPPALFGRQGRSAQQNGESELREQ